MGRGWEAINLIRGVVLAPILLAPLLPLAALLLGFEIRATTDQG